MTTNELMSLVNAGFSKTEILYIAGSTSSPGATAVHAQATPPVVGSTYPQPTTPQPFQLSAAPAAPAAPSAPALQQTVQLQQLLSGVDLPPSYDLDKNLQDFYRGLIYGEQTAPPDNITNPSLK